MFSIEKNYIKEQNTLINDLRKELLQNRIELNELKNKLQNNVQTPLDTEDSAILDDKSSSIDESFIHSDNIDDIFKEDSYLKEEEPNINFDIPKIYETYIPKNIIFQLQELNTDQLFRGKKKFVSIIKIKIDVINLLSKQLAPEAYVKFYNKVFNQISSNVYKHEGIINKYTGSDFLIIFGLFDEDYSRSAKNVLNCVKELNNKIEIINEYLDEKNLNSIKLSIGIHAGNVIIGQVGPINPNEILIMGDEVVITDYMANLSKEHDFKPIFSETIKDLLDDYIQLNEVDQIEIIGLKKEISVYQL
ncbi:MAG: adenylate/guanylate cyclase domain-containing protein [Spirochaetota bacterium]|nr:adenylate/guanylate cyclase domain-containing protein [Spirochaetota bacterium]